MNGRRCETGLGAWPNVSLAEARRAAAEIQASARAGVDLLAERDRARREAEAAQARAQSFDDATRAFIASKEAAWTNPKHRQQWRNSLATYAGSIIGDVNVADVDTAMAMKVLEPIDLRPVWSLI